MSKITLLLFLVPLLAACQPKEKFEWDTGISAPRFYASSPRVVFLYKGKPVGGASSMVGIGSGWGEPTGGYAGGSDDTEVPDSLYVEWLCGTDRYYYKGTFKLPREKMLALFRQPVTAFNGLEYPYSLIIVGTAPGGNVTVWMRAINVLTEIGKFKAKNTGVWKEDDEDYNKYWGDAEENKKYRNNDFNVFHYLHGIPYEVWEKGEKKYNYDIGFTSEGDNMKINILTIFTKAGAVFQPDTYSESPFTIDKTEWNKPIFLLNNNKIKQTPLPVMMKVEIRSKINRDLYYATDVVLPVNFENTYNEKYIDTVSGKKESYNRIIIGVYTDKKKGVIFLEGIHKRTKIMEFKLYDALLDSSGNYISGGYSLPKNFNFPKWEGREKLIPPDIEFWREE